MNKIVRESRHIWVGNLPENVREEQIQDYFSRFGRVEKVKLLTKSSPDGGKAAFVDFVDIRSATKANEAQNRMGDRDLRTNYNEPGGNKGNQDFGRGVQAVRTYGNYPPAPGIPYRGQPVVIYAAPPPANHLIRTAAAYPIPHRDERKVIAPYQPRRERGRSPVSRGSASDDDHSVSPTRRSRGTADYSSDSDASGGKFSKRTTIIVQNLVARNSDSSLEEALYYEFKKYGAILNIVIKGTGPDRHAYIKFMKAEAAEEALAVSGKLFLGQEMKIVLKGGSSKRRSSKGGAPPGGVGVGVVGPPVDLEFDPHATRTVFIGNLEKTTSHGELRGIFEHFGDVVDVDIKKMQTGLTTYAFIQYIDIDGAMRAKRKMDRQYIGQNRLKVGYGRGTPTNSLWVGNLPVNVAEHQISKAFHPFGYVQRTLIDKQHWQALVRFETIEACTRAFAEMHGKQLLGKRLLVDYASPSCRDGFYSRMERNGLLDRHQLEPSPTPPDAHINFQNPARAGGGRFQPRGTFNTQPAPSVTSNPQYSPRDTSRDYDHDRYLERKGEYDKDLREYNAARDKYRGRRSLSLSLSPKRRRSRDSVSPVSSVGLYGDRKIKVKKEKKRKRQADDSPVMSFDEPISKKKKKEKKKEKKEKAKREKAAVKGSIDLAYMNEDEESKASRDVSPPPMKSKMEIKKEKKERKRAEKAEKERKKAEKKQKKLAKKKDAEEAMNNSIMSNMNNNTTDVTENPTAAVAVKQESSNADVQNDKPATESTPATKEPETTATESTTNGVSEADSKPVTENGTDDGAIKAANSEDTTTGESKTNETNDNESSEPKVNGTPTKNGTTEKDSTVIPSDSNNAAAAASTTEAKPTDNISNNSNYNKDNDMKTMNNKRRKSTGDKKGRSDSKDSSDSSSSSSSSSSESDDSDDSSDDDDDKDPKHRGYRHPKDRHRKSMAHDKKDDLSKSREPKAYRQGSLSDYPRDSLRDRSLEREREYKFKYSSDGRKRSPSSERDRRRPSSISKSRGRSNSPLRRSPLASDRARSRSPFERRRGRSPMRTKPSDRMDRKDMSHSRSDRDRTPPPPPREIQKPIDSQQGLSYPPKPMAIGNPVYSTPAGTGAENPDTLLDLLRRFPVMWQGLLGLKNDTAAVQMHFLSGNVNLAEQSLPRGAQPHDVPPPLRISQRMKLEPSQLEGVDKRIQHQKEHCMLLALPCGRDPLDVHAQTRALKTGFITYLQQKQAAGIINVASPQTKTAQFVVHIFPPCEFAQGHLARVAPDLLNSAADSGHLMVLITPL